MRGVSYLSLLNNMLANTYYIYMYVAPPIYYDAQLKVSDLESESYTHLELENVFHNKAKMQNISLTVGYIQS